MLEDFSELANNDVQPLLNESKIEIMSLWFDEKMN